MPKGFRKHSIDTEIGPNGYLCGEINVCKARMVKKIKELYNEFKPYIRVDLVMYGVMILLIVLYFVVSIFL